MMLLTIYLRTALSFIAVQTLPVLLSRRTSLQKTSVSGRSMSTLLLGPESDSGDKSNNYNWRHFSKFNKNSWIKHLLKKTGYTAPVLLQYLPDVRKLWDGQLWFCEEILCHGTWWETIAYQPLEINPPIIYLWPGLPRQKQLVTLHPRDAQINWMLI